MLQSVTVDGFKSLRNCTLKLEEKVTCLVGLNGAGKSTLLQAMSFMSALVQGRVGEWLTRRHWTEKDLKSRLTSEACSSGNISFAAVIRLSSGSCVRWKACFNTSQRCCTLEEVWRQESESGHCLLRVEGNRLSLYGKDWEEIGHRYEGSILSSLTDARLPFEGRQVRGILSSLRSLDGLHCQEMCGSFRNEAEDAIGAAGEEIVAYLSTRHEDEIKGTLVPPLKQFFPSLVDVRLKKKRCGRAELWIKERFGGQTIEVKALHCSDGLLRLLGIVTALNTSADVLCFDEIGNSISVDVCSPLVDTLMQSGKQVVITTHNMLLVNSLPPKAIRLIYKTTAAATQVTDFCELPEVRKSLEVFGPGDALLDLSLSKVTEEAICVNAAEAEVVKKV